MRRTTEIILPALAGAVIGLAARSAAAAPKDAAALKLDADAMGNDYLATKFGSAEKKLQRALAICEKGACSPEVLAQIHRDLGAVQITGLDKLAEGKEELAEALKDDPSITLDKDYSTPALEKAFKEAKGATSPQKAAGGPSGEVEHTPVTEQTPKTPIPIFARWKGQDAAARLVVRYRGAGEKKLRSVPMAPSGEGYAAEIPCDAAPLEGEILYFIEAFDDDGAIVGRHGSREDPHAVVLRNELEGDAPHLPGAPAPAHCKEVCAGDGCEGARPASSPRRNWFTLTFQQDFAIVEGQGDVCTFDAQTSGGYSCFRAKGSQYHGAPLLGQQDKVNGGIAPATTRIDLAYDRALFEGLTIGLHLGFVLRGGGPRADGADVHPFLPIHVEGRAAYWFGADVFSTAGFRPFVFAGGGAAQVDAKFSVIVHEDRSRPPPPAQLDNPAQQALTAYRRMGQGFVSLGGGVMYAITPGAGFVLGLKYMHLFPTPGNVISPEVSFALGI